MPNAPLVPYHEMIFPVPEFAKTIGNPSPELIVSGLTRTATGPVYRAGRGWVHASDITANVRDPDRTL
jgi:hypothetical protein